MKRIKFLLCIILVIFIGCISSCKEVTILNGQDHGKVKYYVAGLYLEVHKDSKYTMDDSNPKVYFQFEPTKYFGYFTTTSGSGNSTIVKNYVTNNQKVEDDVNKYFGSLNFSFMDESVTSVNLYLITVDSLGNYTINNKVTEKLDLESNSSYEFINKFTYDKQKYQIQIQLKNN